MAPEACISSHHFSGRRADVWALGVTLFAFIFGKLPFMAKSVHLIYEAIAHQDFVMPNEPQIPDSLKHLLHRLLDKNPETRITIAQLLQDEWVTDNGKWQGGMAFDEQQLIQQQQLESTTSEQKIDPEAITNKLSPAVESVSHASPLLPITVSEQEVDSAFTLVRRVQMLVRLKSKMRAHRTKARHAAIGSGQGIGRGVMTPHDGNQPEVLRARSLSLHQVRRHQLESVQHAPQSQAAIGSNAAATAEARISQSHAANHLMPLQDNRSAPVSDNESSISVHHLVVPPSLMHHSQSERSSPQPH